MDIKRLAKKGVKNPTKVPPHIIGRIFSNSRFGPQWQRKNGVITWNDNWKWGNESPPDISATDFHQYKILNDIFQERTVDRGLEVGCGYGRVLPWIAESTGADMEGIDANPDAIETAREHYPGFDFDTQNAANLSYDDDSFDLVVTWTVLHHIPPGKIDNVTAELERVLEPEGLLISLENTKGDLEGGSVWSRSRGEYGEMLGGCELIDAKGYDLPHTERKSDLELLVFRREED